MANDAEVERLEGAGATVHKRLHSPEIDHYFVAMRDPKATSPTSSSLAP